MKPKPYSQLIALTLWCFCSVSCLANFEKPDDVSKILKQQAVVKGDFKQFKTLKGIPRRIQSHGFFVFWKDQAIHWRTLKPFFQASTFTPKETLSWAADGSPDNSNSNKSVMQKEISKVLIIIMGGDFEKTTKLFTSEWEFENNIWRVVLTPKHVTVSNVIANISVSGSDNVEQLSITAANGDHTRIEFHNLQSFQTLSSDECHQILGKNASPCLIEP